jgi:hypothetical protein
MQPTARAGAVDGLKASIDVDLTMAAWPDTELAAWEVAAQPPGTIARLPRPDVAGDDVGAVIESYRRRALAADAMSALVGSVIAVVARFGGGWDPGYALLTVVLPALWLVVLGFQRAYERRFMGTGTEEYRRIADGGLVLFTVLAVASFVARAELSRAYVVVAVPVVVGLSLVSRHVLRSWLFRLRVAGRGQQRCWSWGGRMPRCP